MLLHFIQNKNEFSGIMFMKYDVSPTHKCSNTRVNSPYFGHLWTKTHITMTITTKNINWLLLKHVISFGQSKYVLKGMLPCEKIVLQSFIPDHFCCPNIGHLMPNFGQLFYLKR